MNTIEVAAVNSAVCNPEPLLIFLAHKRDAKKLSSQNEYFNKHLGIPTLQKKKKCACVYPDVKVKGAESQRRLEMYSSDLVHPV